MKTLITLLSLLASAALLHAQADPTSRSWNQPVEPYRIVGNLYYVGASDITSYLITTPEGHILLDGGFVETAPIIEASIKKLGFKLEDVKILLSSHAHFDHVGGLAELKRVTGAKFAAMDRDAPLLARGGKGDFLFGDKDPFPPIQADRILHDGDTVTLGGTTLTAHLTPGHTMGNTTWTMKAKEGDRTYDVVFAASTTVLPGVRLTNNPKYPEIAEDYAKTFRVLKSLPCDVFLGSHASFFDGLGKADRLRKGAKENPFVDPRGYKDYVARGERKYLEQVRAERVKP
ncbi:MAG TPA: subclass B3 metallo-beta-lactamase [Thermoanaerobaculia bacterium]